jgi:hypothetical protein
MKMRWMLCVASTSSGAFGPLKMVRVIDPTVRRSDRDGCIAADPTSAVEALQHGLLPQSLEGHLLRAWWSRERLFLAPEH